MESNRKWISFHRIVLLLVLKPHETHFDRLLGSRLDLCWSTSSSHYEIVGWLLNISRSSGLWNGLECCWNVVGVSIREATRVSSAIYRSPLMGAGSMWTRAESPTPQSGSWPSWWIYLATLPVQYPPSINIQCLMLFYFPSYFIWVVPVHL